MISSEVNEGVALEDPAMYCSNIGDSSIGQSDQAAISGNTRELANSLMEMKILSGDISIKEVVAFQRRDAQQAQGDGADALNKDHMNLDPKDVQGSEEDPMKVDVNPMVPDDVLRLRKGMLGKKQGMLGN